ncbi:MAG: CIA30 family protein [Flavobacterium sp.]
MKVILFTLLLITFQSMQGQKLLFKFSENKDFKNWNIIDDRVMGGVSQGNFSIDPDGFGRFSGEVSTENNGGFSSLRYSFDPTTIGAKKRISLKIKGDGKSYQCRIKPNPSVSYSYILIFETTGDWQTIEISMEEMYPSFRGRKLDLPNFDHDFISEITFLIGNKTNEKFNLLIDSITLL